MGICCCKGCFEVPIQQNVFFAGRSGSGKTHTLYQFMGCASALDPKPTPGFVRFQFGFAECGEFDLSRWFREATAFAHNNTHTNIPPLYVPCWQPVFNNEVVRFKRHKRAFEVWDPSGDENYIQFWESFYKNVAFDVVIYFIDANKYWNVKEKQGGMHVMKDRMELHTLLCAPELSSCKVNARPFTKQKTKKWILGRTCNSAGYLFEEASGLL